ncbi:MAG TPA: hypothetical protein VLT36_23420 [Candidatus Dormibacteraeota bacterium]|nr:hypothetical protein [Candidatus Dormibacteraeota bacterium]
MPKDIIGSICELLKTEELAELGPGPRPGVSSEADLNRRLAQILSGAELAESNLQLLRALVLLWHDHLDAAHQIAQDVSGADGAFVHGIMHRREPDYGNAGYWFRRVGKHPSFPAIANGIAALAQERKQDAGRLVPNGQWDPFAFIDACEEVARASAPQPRRDFLRGAQKVETVALIEYLATKKADDEESS